VECYGTGFDLVNSVFGDYSDIWRS